MKQLKQETIDLITKELESIPEKYQKDFNSCHEGYAVILEEVRELENSVFFGYKRLFGNVDNHKEEMQKECVQIAAMCVRFIQELTSKSI